jgi:hypothetical protein
MIGRLFRRDDDPPICGEVDGYILTRNHPDDDLPCREHLRTVPAHCNRCGHITAEPTCPTHPTPLRCPTCTLAGEPSRVELVETAAVS